MEYSKVFAKRKLITSCSVFYILLVRENTVSDIALSGFRCRRGIPPSQRVSPPPKCSPSLIFEGKATQKTVVWIDNWLYSKYSIVFCLSLKNILLQEASCYCSINPVSAQHRNKTWNCADFSWTETLPFRTFKKHDRHHNNKRRSYTEHGTEHYLRKWDKTLQNWTETGLTGNLITMLRLPKNTNMFIFRLSRFWHHKTIFETLDTRLLDAICMM